MELLTGFSPLFIQYVVFSILSIGDSFKPSPTAYTIIADKKSRPGGRHINVIKYPLIKALNANLVPNATLY